MEEVKEVEVTEEKEVILDANLFSKLYNLPVEMYVEVLKNNKVELTYLSWAHAYQLLMHQDPDADVEICEAEDGFPLFSRGNHHFVKTKVTAFGKTKTCFLPVMDNNHTWFGRCYHKSCRLPREQSSVLVRLLHPHE